MPRNRLRWIAAAAAFAGALGGAAPARACTISATGVAFGAFDPQSATPDDAAGTLTLGCQPSVQSPVVALGAGNSASFAPRAMANGAIPLNYNLYTNAARTIVWGDGSAGTVTQTLGGGTVNAGTRNFSVTIYGRITALQNVDAGTYGDTIIITVTF